MCKNNVKNIAFFLQNVWWIEIFVIHLHSQKQRNGSVAQLNRVLDYGSSGSRFESWRSHKAAIRDGCRCFFIPIAPPLTFISKSYRFIKISDLQLIMLCIIFVARKVNKTTIKI